MGWKLFGILYAAIAAGMAASVMAGVERAPPEVLGTVLTVAAAAGVLLYAFDRAAGPAAWWAAFAWVWVIWSVAATLIGAYRLAGALAAHPLPALAALATGLAFQLPPWIAIRRLGRAPAPARVRPRSV